MWNLILKGVVTYLEAHPDKVTELIDAGVTAIIGHLKTKQAGS